MTRRGAAYGVLASALAFVIVLFGLLILRPDAPILWALLVIPCATFAWFTRQALMPDDRAPTRWRVRNALGCLFVGMGVPSVFFLIFADALFPPGGPDFVDREGLGLLVVLAIFAALGGIVTLLWGLVEWSVSVIGRAGSADPAPLRSR